MSANDISNSGLIVGQGVRYTFDEHGNVIDQQEKAFLLLPVELKDVSNGQVISDIAWIKGHTSGSDLNPEMPKLEVRLAGAPSEWQVEWKLENRYPRRGIRDDLNIPDAAQGPGIFVAGDQPWTIWQEINNSNGAKFFGGDVTLKYTIHSTAGVGDSGQVIFKIRGENPNDAQCKAHIIANQGAVWYA